MKKTLLIIMTVAAIASAAGCGAKEDNTAANSAAEETVVSQVSDGISGTWQTASIGYIDGDDMQPDYYVEFTDTEINYGHMKDGEFALDHSDKISLLEKREGGYRIQAESANGIKYTYQTSEEDENVLEYYETWNEEEFSEMYRGGASLSR